jgi:hypothetical protein
MAKYHYSADLYTWTPETGQQLAYTLTGEVEAERYYPAISQASYDISVQRIGPDSQIDARTYVKDIHVEQQGEQ